MGAPSDHAIARAVAEQVDKNGNFIHYHLLLRRAREIDTAGPAGAQDDELRKLRQVAILAKQASWIHGACWDLADASGCFISADSMRRFDEVFTSLGQHLGDIGIDEEAEAEMFHRPSELLKRAEAAEAALALYTNSPAAREDAVDAESTRSQFERWISKRWGYSTKRWSDSGNYHSGNTREWWECWQAAIAAAINPGRTPE